MSPQSRRATTDRRPSAVEEEDDDDISITSTIDEQHDSDEEFQVDDVLAEKESENGGKHYLIQWTGFPVHQCTWEPESNLGPELHETWEENRAQQMRGERVPFDPQVWVDAQEKFIKDKEERHRRRNAKRKKLGFAMTEPLPDDLSDEFNGSEAPSESDSSDESIEDNFVDRNAAAATKPKPALVQLPKPKQNIFKGVPTPARPGVIKEADSGRRANVAKKVPASTSGSSSSEPRLSIQTTGYQGTARSSTGKTTKSTDATNLSGAMRPQPKTPGKLAMMARKTSANARGKLSTQSIGNVFASGKTRKARKGLGEVMNDSSKAPQFFGNHRLKRQAELKGRSKEDKAPDASVLKAALFDISKGPDPNRKSSAEIRGGKNASNGLTNRSPVVSADTTFIPSPEESQSGTTATPPNIQATKKRKSVRFIEEEEGQGQFVEEPMEIDPPSFPTKTTAPSKSVPVRPVPPSAAKKLSITDYQARHVFQSVTKAIAFGTTADPVEVVFNGIPRESTHPWLAKFLEQATLSFAHVCLAQTLAEQVVQVRKERLCHGTVTSTSAGGMLDVVADNLRLSLLGLFCAQSEYNIVVYPTKCEEWKTDAIDAETSSPTEVALRFVAFSATVDFAQRLAPLNNVADPLAQGIASNKPLSDRAYFMHQSFNFEYSKLLPGSTAHPDSRPIFILVFPQSRAETLVKSVFFWLRDCDPSCSIYLSNYPGAWTDFTSRVTQKTEPQLGVVIVHDSIAYTMRRFPGILNLISTINCAFWSLSESIQPRPIFPSIRPLDKINPPGQIDFIRLFPYRNAILVTPSFLVSEPRRSLELFEWFKIKWAATSDYKLVTAWDIPAYLEELAYQKSRDKDELWKESQGIVVNYEINANLRALSHLDCEARFKARSVVSELVDMREDRGGLLASNEENSPLIYAPESIDPNDEQSLLNWFGWWSTQRMDQFKKFHVVGSSEDMTKEGMRTGERDIRIPKFSPLCINAPDAVMSVLDSEDEPENPEPSSSNLAPSDSVTTDGRGKIPPAKTELAQFRSDRFRTDSGKELHQYLSSKANKPREPWERTVWTLYNKAIFWPDAEMSYKFGDLRHDGATLKEWFTFQHSFRGAFNTYIGFFYSPIDDSSDAPVSAGKPLRRHPWLGIYRRVWRPENPTPNCEVIIWDSEAPQRCPGNRLPTENDLLGMQRQLIAYVREHTAEKNQRSSLQQVWVGGFAPAPSCTSPHAIDKTAAFLDAVTGSMEGLKEHLPAPARYLPERGYRRLAGSDDSFSNHRETSGHFAGDYYQPPAAGSGDAMDLDDTEPVDDQEDTDARIIFHPPRGSTYKTGEQSKCGNRLFEQARLARIRNRDVVYMKYQFRPTLDWYKEQQEEGRGFGHINVASWVTIFENLRIGKRRTRSED